MVADAELLDAVNDLGPASTREIADAVGATRRAAEYRLRKLYAEGEVDSERIGSSLVWTLPEDTAAVDPLR